MESHQAVWLFRNRIEEMIAERGLDTEKSEVGMKILVGHSPGFNVYQEKKEITNSICIDIYYKRDAFINYYR